MKNSSTLSDHDYSNYDTSKVCVQKAFHAGYTQHRGPAVDCNPYPNNSLCWEVYEIGKYLQIDGLCFGKITHHRCMSYNNSGYFFTVDQLNNDKLIMQYDCQNGRIICERI